MGSWTYGGEAWGEVDLGVTVTGLVEVRIWNICLREKGQNRMEIRDMNLGKARAGLLSARLCVGS